MPFLLTCSRWIDAVNERVGRAAAWLVLACVVVSAGNAVARYGFNFSSNAFLEIQWYLYSIVYLCAAGYTLKHNAHVRVDIACRPAGSCLAAGSVVVVDVRTQVRLPLMPSVLGGGAPSIRVDAAHTVPYGSFREDRS